MNDPNGPVFANGKYHLFNQYNPEGAKWGHMSWAHSVSDDLVSWTHLPVALLPNNTYDSGGVFSGSITIVNGKPIISYTCVGPHGQLQCLASAKDPTDPNLIDWVKDPSNPVIAQQPPTTPSNDFRDDTTAWLVPGANGQGQRWAMAMSALENNTAGVVVYVTPNASSPLKPLTRHGVLYSSGETGTMWECPDFALFPG